MRKEINAGEGVAGGSVKWGGHSLTGVGAWVPLKGAEMEPQLGDRTSDQSTCHRRVLPAARRAAGRQVARAQRTGKTVGGWSRT